MSRVRENRLFLGNPGSGKSTLINCLIGAPTLRAGLSWGGGLTQDYQRVDHDGVAYMDTPGLADETIAEQAAMAITTALKQGGTYKLFFLVRLQAGRVVSEDLVTLERVLSAIDVAPTRIRFSVIFNNVDKRQYAAFTEPNSDAFAAVHSVVNSRQFHTDAFCFIPQMAELEDASDAAVPLPPHVRDFMDEEAPSMRIDPRTVKPVDPTGFAEQVQRIKQEMATLLSSRSNMMTALATQQQQHREAMERERAAHAVELESFRSRQATPDDRGYEAHPRTPQAGKATATRRKRLLVVAGVVVGVVVLVTIIVVAATRGGGSKTTGGTAAGNSTTLVDPIVTTTPPSPSPPPTTTATRAPPNDPKFSEVGCVIRVNLGDPAGRDAVSPSNNQNYTITQAYDFALEKNRKYFAVVKGRNTTVGNEMFTFSEPWNGKIPQACDEATPGQLVWAIYEATAEKKNKPNGRSNNTSEAIVKGTTSGARE